MYSSDLACRPGYPSRKYVLICFSSVIIVWYKTMTVPITAEAELHSVIFDYISNTKRRMVGLVDEVSRKNRPPLGRQRAANGPSFKRTLLCLRVDTEGVEQ